MKRRIGIICMMSIIALMCSIVCAHAQTTLSTGNGGQYAENGSVKLEFGGLISGRLVWLKVWNKQNGTADIRVTNGTDVTVSGIPAHSYDTIHIVVPTDFKIKAKALTNLGGTDFGWVELYVPASSLPATILSIKVTKIRIQRTKH
jgi:hypothetical protein